MVGGSTRIPKINSMLKERVWRHPTTFKVLKWVIENRSIAKGSPVFLPILTCARAGPALLSSLLSVEGQFAISWDQIFMNEVGEGPYTLHNPRLRSMHPQTPTYSPNIPHKKCRPKMVRARAATFRAALLMGYIWRMGRCLWVHRPQTRVV